MSDTAMDVPSMEEFQAGLEMEFMPLSDYQRMLARLAAQRRNIDELLLACKAAAEQLTAAESLMRVEHPSEIGLTQLNCKIACLKVREICNAAIAETERRLDADE